MAPMQWSSFAGGGPALYERVMVGPTFLPWAQELLAAAPPRPADRVLDVACGTGAVTRLVLERLGEDGRVVGLDVSPGMLDMARTTVADPRATWLEGSAAVLPLPAASFDVVLCQQGLQYFPDRPTALREMARVLIPGGRLGLSVFCASPAYVAMSGAVARHLGEEAAASVRGPIALADSDLIRADVAAGGFRDVEIRRVVRTSRFEVPDGFVEYMLTSRLAGAVVALDEVERAEFLADIARALAPYATGGALVLPMESHIVTAHT